MVIRKKRIRNVRRHLSNFTAGQAIIISCPVARIEENRLSEIGLELPVSLGDRVLPGAIGPVSRLNAEGKHIPLKDREMETAYRQTEWPWVEWHGRYRVHQSKIVDVPYQRYPREFVPPPSIELEVRQTADGTLALIADPIPYTEASVGELRHVVNLFLELFGECEPLDTNLLPKVRIRARRVNWIILPPGQYPWDAAREGIVRRALDGNQPVVRHRLETIIRYGPDDVVEGRGGFADYVVFLFRSRGLAVVESARYPNATYVFGEDWEALSQMTKREILTGSLEEERVIHQRGWERRIHELLS